MSETFKVGDRVRITNNARWWAGLMGTVTNCGHNPSLRLDDGREVHVVKSCLELAQPPQHRAARPPNPTPEKGDEVEVTIRGEVSFANATNFTVDHTHGLQTAKVDRIVITKKQEPKPSERKYRNGDIIRTPKNTYIYVDNSITRHLISIPNGGSWPLTVLNEYAYAPENIRVVGNALDLGTESE